MNKHILYDITRETESKCYLIGYHSWRYLTSLSILWTSWATESTPKIIVCFFIIFKIHCGWISWSREKSQNWRAVKTTRAALTRQPQWLTSMVPSRWSKLHSLILNYKMLKPFWIWEILPKQSIYLSSASKTDASTDEGSLLIDSNVLCWN